MSTETQPPTPPEPESEPKPGLIETVRSVIADELGKLFDSGKADVTEGKPGGDPARGRDRSDVAADVKREVEKLRADEAEQAKKVSLEQRIAELEKQLKSAFENPPEEFRWITEKMWR